MVAKTMFDKIWDAHLVKEVEGQPSLLYIDLHLVHEVTSPQAFDGLRMAGRPVSRPDLQWQWLNITLPLGISRFP